MVAVSVVAEPGGVILLSSTKIRTVTRSNRVIVGRIVIEAVKRILHLHLHQSPLSTRLGIQSWRRGSVEREWGRCTFSCSESQDIDIIGTVTIASEISRCLQCNLSVRRFE